MNEQDVLTSLPRDLSVLPVWNLQFTLHNLLYYQKKLTKEQESHQSCIYSIRLTDLDSKYAIVQHHKAMIADLTARISKLEEEIDRFDKEENSRIS